MTSENDILFEVMTPLGFRVRVSQAYWKLITEIKHPVMAGREEDVRRALETPMKSAGVSRMKTSICFIDQNGKSVGYVPFLNKPVETAF